ncbi:MAG: hypothetical protein GX300_08395 [Tissierellia bacterium]|nr:hypothetical protein [Tissierellia bacterium]
MDWSKAKTILIIAFIVTNILLGYVLLSSEKQVETTLKDSFVEDVIEILGRKEIIINTDIPREIPSLNTLTVEYEAIEPYEANRIFFNGEGKVENKEAGVIEIVFEEEYLTITNKKYLSYTNNNMKEMYPDLNEEKAIELALDFLEQRKYNVSDMKLSFIKRYENGYNLEFTKLYNDRYLEKSNTSVVIDSSGVKKMERMWLNPIEEGEKYIYINTAPKALLSLLSIEETHGKTIEEISLCYYFDPAEQDFIDNPNMAIRGKTIPAWRVLFEDGIKLIIDNY